MLYRCATTAALKMTVVITIVIALIAADGGLRLTQAEVTFDFQPIPFFFQRV